MQDNKPHILDFGEPEKENSIIKVIGVGGGGGNAVNHMYREGIHDVSFVLCNTDNQALNDSPVPVHLQLGKEGLGAGNKPEKAKQAAEETLDDIKHMLDDGTKTLPCAINVVTDEPGRTVMEMTLKEGKNREIRRMCEAVGLEVVRLKRNAEGVVKLGMLKPGTYRELTKAEINGLRSAAAKGRAQTRSAALQSKAAERRPRGPVGKSAPKKRK